MAVGNRAFGCPSRRAYTTLGISHSPSTGPRQSLRAIFLNREVTQHGPAAFIVMHKSYGGDEGFDDVDFLQRSDDEQLQIKPPEQLQPVTRRFIRAAPERLVYQHEAERS